MKPWFLFPARAADHSANARLDEVPGERSLPRARAAPSRMQRFGPVAAPFQVACAGSPPEPPAPPRALPSDHTAHIELVPVEVAEIATIELTAARPGRALVRAAEA